MLCYCMKCRNDGYRADLEIRQIIAELGRLFASQRRIERLICRYLADLADCIAAEPLTVLGGYADIYHAGRVLFGLSVRAIRERVRVGQALRELPRIEGALVEGQLSYSRVREVTRVATAETEAQWFEAAVELPMRVLERRVVEAGGGDGGGKDDDGGSGAAVSWANADTVDVRLRMGAAAWAMLERAMEGARRAAEGTALLTDAEALEAVARDALCRQEEGEGGEPSDPRRNVVLYECQLCGRTELDTGRGAIEVGDGAAAALGCGATERDLRTEGRVVKRGGPLPAQTKRAVRLRDRDRCRVPGCGRRRYVDVHHIEHQSAGGTHARSNCCVLCSTHHRQLHEGRLRVEGDADAELRFYDDGGEAIVAGRAAIAGWVTQGGSWGSADDGRDSAGGGGVATQGGSSPATGHFLDDEGDEAAGEDLGPSALPPEAGQLLVAMGARGGWHADALCAATGLSYRQVSGALLQLVLAGRVEESFCHYEVVAGCGVSSARAAGHEVVARAPGWPR